ncbi:MAG: class I SAM-dependent methyltransferase [Pelagibacteraceae bacterium]|nr:class I SAM-dependent methyltransferase [Pelagibacteraceae bacterium]
MSDKNNLEELMTEYYKKYYKTELGLSDWQERVDLRLNEEEVFCTKYINLIEELLSYDFSGKKVLVVGCGTGGELVNFHKKGSQVYGIEPNQDAIKICNIKALKNEIPKDNIIKSYSEKLPFDNNQFDLIYCFTVLEHVNDIEQSIKEMIRCTKVKGKLFIELPNYRQLYEAHYKLPLPMFLPIWFNKIILRLLRRPVDYLDTLNIATTRQLRNIYRNSPEVIPMLVLLDDKLFKMRKIRFNLVFVIQGIQFLIFKIFNQSANQIWILHKTNTSKL